jgi:hypothetical protein
MALKLAKPVSGKGLPRPLPVETPNDARPLAK